MHFYNPMFGAFARQPVARRLRVTGRTRSLVAVVPQEYAGRIDAEPGASLLAVLVRDGLYLYPATPDHARTLATLGEVLRTQRQVLHAMGSAC